MCPPASVPSFRPGPSPPSLLPFHRGLKLRLKVEGRELSAVSLVELILELDPVEAQRVQEGGEQPLSEPAWAARRKTDPPMGRARSQETKHLENARREI